MRCSPLRDCLARVSAQCRTRHLCAGILLHPQLFQAICHACHDLASELLLVFALLRAQAARA